MSKRFLIIMLAAVAVFIGIIIVQKKDAGAPGGNESAGGGPTNHVSGEGSSGVNVTEYGDFQCPACFNYYPIFKQLKQEYGDRVTFQFRHFPIMSIHQNAMAAHRAAEAAGLQGKFWEMHDLLYERQKSWESSNNPAGVFEGYASELGLDLEKFKTDVTSSATNSSIQADLKAGQDLGVSGTPTFTVDGKVIETPNSPEAFRAIIEEALSAETSGQDE